MFFHQISRVIDGYGFDLPLQCFSQDRQGCRVVPVYTDGDWDLMLVDDFEYVFVLVEEFLVNTLFFFKGEDADVGW